MGPGPAEEDGAEAGAEAMREMEEGRTRGEEEEEKEGEKEEEEEEEGFADAVSEPEREAEEEGELEDLDGLDSAGSRRRTSGSSEQSARRRRRLRRSMEEETDAKAKMPQLERHASQISFVQVLEALSLEALGEGERQSLPRVFSLLQALKAAREGESSELLPRTINTENPDLLERLMLYQAWCCLLRETLLENKFQLLDGLFEFMESFVVRFPPEGVGSTVEQLRLYVTLRTAFQSHGLSGVNQNLAFEFASVLPLGPLLPYMVTSIAADEFEGIVEEIFGVNYGTYCLENATANIDTNLSSIDRTTQGACVATLHVVEELRRFAEEQPCMPFNTFDRKVGIMRLKSRRQRGEALAGLINYLVDMERNFDRAVDVDTKFGIIRQHLTKYSRAFPPSLGVAETVYLKSVELYRTAIEVHHDGDMKVHLKELVEETKEIFLRALETARNSSIESASQRSMSFQSYSSYDMFKSGHMSSSMLLSGGKQDVGLLSKTGSASRGSGFINPFDGPLMRRSPGVEENKQGLGAQSVEKRYEPTSAQYDSVHFANAPSGTIVAKVPDIWLQVDPSLESVELNAPDVVGENELTSKTRGVVRIFNDKVTWTMFRTKAKPQHTHDEADEDELRHDGSFKSSDASSSVIGNQGGEPDSSAEEDHDDPSTDNSHIYDAERTSSRMPTLYKEMFGSGFMPGKGVGEHSKRSREIPGHLQNISEPVGLDFHRLLTSYMYSSLADQYSQSSLMIGDLDPVRDPCKSVRKEEVVESEFCIPMNRIRKYMWGSLDESHMYLALYTTEVIKLFPFSRAEISEILRTLKDFTGTKPTSLKSKTNVQQQRRLENLRLRILEEKILKRSIRWITHTEELNNVLHDLAKNDSFGRMVEMERLFHSCRNNKLVINEAILILKEIWAQAKTEDKMMKILGIVNRLLDSNILNGDDAILVDVLKWLHSIETTLDPYSNAMALKHLLKVCHRAESLQSKTIVPLIESFYDKSIFDMDNAYRDFLRNSNATTTERI